MVNIGKVTMFGLPVGIVRWDEARDLAQFEYDRDFAERGIEPSPLMMPVRAGRVYSFGNLNRDTYRGLPGMLADSLPDTYGRTIFDKWLSMTGRTSGNALETLCFLGKRCMGALEFESVLDAGADPDRKFEVDALVNVAKDALSEKGGFHSNMDEEGKDAIARILRLGTSAGPTCWTAPRKTASPTVRPLSTRFARLSPHGLPSPATAGSRKPSLTSSSPTSSPPSELLCSLWAHPLVGRLLRHDAPLRLHRHPAQSPQSQHLTPLLLPQTYNFEITALV